jgi:predicted NAD-dependent protein-ADP-ribosyltransferase YbiA (DUF1768 family)
MDGKTQQCIAENSSTMSQRHHTKGEPVCIYNKDGEFASFSNFYPFYRHSGFVMFTKASNGLLIKFNSSEQYIHYAKFCTGPGTTDMSHEFAEVIRTADTAAKTATLGKQPKSRWRLNVKVCPGKDERTLAQVLDIYTREAAPARTDWHEVRLAVIQKALLCKFMQNPDLRDMLLSTGDRPIFECSPTDTFWDIGSKPPARILGENHLGTLLEDLRFRLKNTDF